MEKNEGMKSRASWNIYKFHDPDGSIERTLRAGARIEDVPGMIGHERIETNLCLNEGLQALIALIAGTAAETAWNAANAYIGVGESATAADPIQTGLQGATKTYKAMDSTFPQRTNQTCEWRATFGSGDANIAWNEYTVSNSNSDTGKNLNRKVESKGTKVVGETWTLSLQITFS